MPTTKYTPPVALKWNRFACDALYLTNTPPTIATRALAILHTAMYDAMTLLLPGAETGTTPEFQRLKAQEIPCDYTPENRQEAYSYAAYRVLTRDAIFANPLPDSFKSELKEFFCSLGYRPGNYDEDPAKPSGSGNLAARLILESRLNDGSNQENGFVDYTGYKPANASYPALPGSVDRWQPQIMPDEKPQAFLTAHWGSVRPFALSSGGQFRPGPPIACGEAGFKEQGDYLADISACLTDEQKIIAEFWAGMHEDQYEGLPTKDNYSHWATPPAQLCRMACEILEDRERYGIPVVVFLFVLSNALMDAGIAAWDCKRHYDYVRPVTLIWRMKDNEKFPSWGGPGRGTIEIEGEGWQPYIPTPPFAEYVSGHSTFSRAMAEIVKCFFGDGRYGREVCIPSGGSKIEGKCDPPLPAEPIVLKWETVDEAADQAGMSRLYGGIHFVDGDRQGRELGKKVARCTWEKACHYLDGKVPS